MGVSSGCSGSCSVKGFASESRAHDTPLTYSFQWLQCYHQEAAPMYRARTLLSVLTILSTCPAQNLGISLCCTGRPGWGLCSSTFIAGRHILERRAWNSCSDVAHDFQVVLRRPARGTQVRVGFRAIWVDDAPPLQ